MNRRNCYILPMLFIMMSFIVAPVTAFAISNTYGVVIDGYDSDDDPIYKAYTDDPDFQMGTGFVRFWLYEDSDCSPPVDEMSPNQPHLMLYDDGSGYWVQYYSFDGYGDTIVCVKAHFQGGYLSPSSPTDKSEWSVCIKVPWFTSLPMAMLAGIGGVAYLKKRKKL